MKEFSAQTGGRYTYVDDVLNLQDLALAFGNIFNNCGNFIISGCEVSGNSISAGYVFINGKIRSFSGASSVLFPCYICESNSTENVDYVSGGTKVGRKVYGSRFSAVLPTTPDPVTNVIPGVIRISDTGGVLMKDAFIGRYSVLKDASDTAQEIKGNITVKGTFKTNAISASGEISEDVGVAKYRAYYTGSTLNIESQIKSGNTYKLSMQDSTGFAFYVNSTLVFAVNNDCVRLSVPLAYGSVVINNDGISTKEIYNSGEDTNTAAIRINMLGYNKGDTRFRDTIIGNGKNKAMLLIAGNGDYATFACPVYSQIANPVALILKSAQLKTDNSLQKVIHWQASNSECIAYMGYDSADSQHFTLVNNIGDIVIKGNNVNILGALKLNGVSLDSTYITRDAVVKDYVSKTLLQEVLADRNVATVDGGFMQFMGTNSQAALRDQISAASKNDVNECVKKNQYLADMATSEAIKRQIRDNIGAASKSEVVQTDSGWQKASDGIFIRQVGHIVSIQGKLPKTFVPNEVICTIPNSITPPTYSVGVYFDNHMHITINPNERNVVYRGQSNVSPTILPTITYLV